MGAEANVLPAAGGGGDARAPAFAGTPLKEEEAAVRCMVAVLYSPHSRAAAAAAAAAAEQQQRLPTPAEANVFLTDFQQRPAAWPVCIAILNRFTVQQQQLEQHGQQQQQETGDDDEDFQSSLLYFAAQTLASVARAGFPQQLQLLLGSSSIPGVATDVANAAAAERGSTEQQRREEEEREQAAATAASVVYKELRQGLLQLLFGCRRAPRAVVRQLACALANALLCGAACKRSCFSGAGAAAAAAASHRSSSGVRNTERSSRGHGSAQRFSGAAAEATAGEDVAATEGEDSEDAAAARQRRDAEEDGWWKELATDLDEVLLALGRNVGPAGAAPLLELLIVLPQEVASPRVAVQDGKRLCVLLAMLRRYTVDALVAAASVFQSAAHAEQQLRQQEQRRPQQQEPQNDASAGGKLQEEAWWYLQKTAICAMRAWLSAHLQLFLSLPAIAALSPHFETAATSCCRGLFVALHRHHLPRGMSEEGAMLTGGSSAAAILPGSPSSVSASAAAGAATPPSPPLGAALTDDVEDRIDASSPLGILLQCLSRAAVTSVVDAPGGSVLGPQQQEQKQQMRRAELETLQEASEAVAALAALAVGLASPQQQRQEQSSSSPEQQQAEQEQKQAAEEQQLQASLPSIHCVLQQVIHCYADACAHLQDLIFDPPSQQQQSVLLAADRLHAFSQGLLELAKEVLPGFLHNAVWPLDDATAAKNAAAAAAAAAESLPFASFRSNSGLSVDLCSSSSSSSTGTEREDMDSSSNSDSRGGGSSSGRRRRSSIRESVKEICAFVVHVLMRHPCLDAKEIAVDFHYNLLFHFVTLASEQQELLQRLEALQYEQQQHVNGAASWGCSKGDSSSGSGSGEIMAEDLEAGPGAGDGVAEEESERDAAGGSATAEGTAESAAAGHLHNTNSSRSRSSSSSTYAQLASEIAAARASYAWLAQEVEEKRQRLQPLLLQFLDVLMVEVGPPSAAAVLQDAAAAGSASAAAGRAGPTGAAAAAGAPGGVGPTAAPASYGSQQQQEPSVDLERWGQLRDESAIDLVEATIVTGHRPLLQKATGNMATALHALDPAAAADQSPGDCDDVGDGGCGSVAAAPWQRLEASLFVVTTLASRCKGKEAAFIPQTLQLLPQILLPLTDAAAMAAARAQAAAAAASAAAASAAAGGGRGEGGGGEAAGTAEEKSAAGVDASPEEEGAVAARVAAARAARAKRKEEEAEVVCLFMYTAAGRFILWTAGYAAHDRHLFAALFELLARQGMQFLISTAQRHREETSMEAESAAACQLRAAAEDIVIEALKALVAAAAPTLLVADEAADDVTFLLQCLVSLVLLDGLSVESRSGLILAAGAALAPLPAARMRSLHSQMLQSLGANLCDALAEQQQGGGRRSSAATAARHAVTLFFAGLQCVRPAHVVLPPPGPPSDCCEPLPPDSPYRHPVLDVLEEHWHVVEAVMHAPVKQEYLYEQSCYAIFSIISAARPHIPRYTIFYRFLESLATSFEAYPTAYHLGVLRSLAGLCGGGAEQHLLTAVAVCLKRCTLSILRHIQEEGDRYVYRQPDLVGMMVDCVNISLLHVHLVLLCVGKNGGELSSSNISSNDGWFEALTLAVLQLAPTCHHPKVLHTFIIFFSRLAAWTNPPAQLYAGITGQNIPWLEQTCDTCQEAMVSLMLRPYPAAAAAGTAVGGGREGTRSCGTYLDATIHAIVKALTSVHAAVQSWIGNAAQALLVLLHQSTVAQQALAALEKAVMGLHPHVLDPHQRASFLRRCRAETNIRNFCLLLQQTANDAKAQFQRSKFAVAATGDFASASSPSPPPAATAAMCVPPAPVVAMAAVAAATPPALPAGTGVASVLSSASAGGACEEAAMT